MTQDKEGTDGAVGLHAGVSPRDDRAGVLANTTDFQSGDSTFGMVYGDAKRSCDGKVGYTCGNVLLELDADGCVIGVTSHTNNLSMDAAAQWFDCMAEQLAGAFSRCEASQARRFFESCTLL